MAGSREKVKKEKKVKEQKRKKEERHISDQLEEKFVGARTEVFSRISAKEVEIRTKTSAERTKADRLIEDAKGQAAAIKRKATLEEIGKDTHAKIIAAAHEEVGEIENSTAKETAEVEKSGEKNLDKAVGFIVEAVVSVPQEGP
ncbi:MAG: hypothetical protein C4536_16400 [Actinobacteria bacterium]|jgi:hypothetical protein|nr:MAG: hypothetical protein C4536_16400 [Actinomycetota bacterium]